MSEIKKKSNLETCPICSSSISKWRDKEVANAIYRLDICSSCGFCFVNPRPSYGFLMEYYSSSGHGSNNVKIDNETENLKQILDKEKEYPNSSIDAKRIINVTKSLCRRKNVLKFLDVGCGYGFYSKEAINNDFEVICIELADNEGEIAKNMTGMIPLKTSFEDYVGKQKSIDVILMSQILEHALDVNSWIKKAHDILNEEGILTIALPNFGSLFRLIMNENEAFICPPSHLNFFNVKSLTLLLENHGFKVEKIDWISRFPKTAIEKRIPEIWKPLVPIIYSISALILKFIDKIHLGMILNIYARKVEVK